MQSAATHRYAKISVRKARVVMNLVRGRYVAEALDLLRFTKKSGAPLVSKLIDSAIANAQQEYKDKVDLDALYIQTAFADKATAKPMRRWRPRAMGRATRVVKGLSHLKVVLGTEE
jgi:large subunit ribosomal protein L22